MSDLGAWRPAPSSNPASSRSPLFEPKKSSDLLLPLFITAAIAALMALTLPKAQISATKDVSSKPQPKLSK